MSRHLSSRSITGKKPEDLETSLKYTATQINYLPATRQYATTWISSTPSTSITEYLHKNITNNSKSVGSP